MVHNCQLRLTERHMLIESRVVFYLHFISMKISAFHKFFFHIASTADSNINDSSKKHIY